MGWNHQPDKVFIYPWGPPKLTFLEVLYGKRTWECKDTVDGSNQLSLVVFAHYLQGLNIAGD